MAGIIYELIDQLEQLISLHEDLLALSRKKTSAIIENNMENLQEITREEESIISKISSIEKKREQSLEDISIVLNRPKTELTIKSIAEMLKKQKNESDKLLDIGARLKNILNELKTINDKNNDLLNHSLEYVEFVVNAITSADRAAPPSYPETDYRREGGGFFDTKQ